MARICLRRIQGFSISEIDPIAGTMTFTNAGENCNLSCAFMPRYKEKLAVLSTEQGASTLALRFHLDSTLLLVSKETESLSFNGEMKCAVEPMKKMATDMERLGAHWKGCSFSDSNSAPILAYVHLRKGAFFPGIRPCDIMPSKLSTGMTMFF